MEFVLTHNSLFLSLNKKKQMNKESCLCETKADCRCYLLVDPIHGFIEQAVVGTFRGMFRAKDRNPDLGKAFALIKTNPPQYAPLNNFYQKIVAQYIDESHDSLLKNGRDDSWAWQSLGHLVSTHSPICIMKVVGSIVLQFCDKIQWNRIGCETLDTLDTTLREQVRSKLKVARPFIDEKFNHNCEFQT